MNNDTDKVLCSDTPVYASTYYTCVGNGCELVSSDNDVYINGFQTISNKYKD